MKNLKFTLTAGDIEGISDALVSDGKHQELIQIFSVIELMDSEIKISVVNKKEPIHKFSELLDDLSLDLDEIIQDPTPEAVEATNTPMTDLPKLVRVPEPVAEPVKEPSEPAAVKKTVIAGWDERVPKPSIDPVFANGGVPAKEEIVVVEEPQQVAIVGSEPEPAQNTNPTNKAWTSEKPSGWVA